MLDTGPDPDETSCKGVPFVELALGACKRGEMSTPELQFRVIDHQRCVHGVLHVSACYGLWLYRATHLFAFDGVIAPGVTSRSFPELQPKLCVL